MKKLILSLVSLSLFLVAAQAQNKNPKPGFSNVKDEKPVIVYEGRGLDGLVIGKSTMDEVAQKFGKNYRWEVNKKYSYQMTYDRLGLSFYICQADKKQQIFLVEIKSPYKARTSKGVTLGKSTKDETEEIYGKPRKGFRYRGINFYYNTFGSKKIISEIDLLENSGVRQCDAEPKKTTK